MRTPKCEVTHLPHRSCVCDESWLDKNEMASRAYEAKFKRDIVTCSRLGLELFMHLEYKYALRMMFFFTSDQRPEGFI